MERTRTMGTEKAHGRCQRRLVEFSWMVVALVVLVHLVTPARASEYSDPLEPPEAEADEAEAVAFYEIPSRLRQVENEARQVRQALEQLAPLDSGKQFDAFGYHSDYVPAVDGVPAKPLWTMDLEGGYFPTKAWVMVPALDQRTAKLSGYAFPKRFRISLLDGQGGGGTVLVDWTGRDFPDPGMRPVYFAFPPEHMRPGVLRLEVFAGHEEEGLEYFALGRIHPIRQGEQQKTVVKSVSSGFESPPYWSQDYLASSRQILGMPLTAHGGGGDNLVMEFPAARLEKPLVIRVELDKAEQLGWVNIFPGQSPVGIDVPGYGFPNQMRIYLLEKKPGEKDFRRFPMQEQVVPGKPGNNMFRLAGGGAMFSALEIECNDFPMYQGKAVFSLGEIEIYKGSRSLSKGRRVTVRGAEAMDEPFDEALLVDGKIGGREILPIADWFRQLAEGKLHQSRLAVLEAEHAELTGRWEMIRKRAVFWGIGLVGTGILALAWFMQRSRKRAEMRLRRQVHSDLHDEVGSNLGSISLMAGQLQELARSDRMKAGMFDLALMAREACASLREVVWLVDQKTIRLPDLIRNLGGRAERVLIGAKVSVELPDGCPDVVVSLSIKRHLVMFFKEAIHNCARHAGAAEVGLSLTVEGRELGVFLRDNGCGFDPSGSSDGWGLGSMKQRAQELGGEMVLCSREGEGTTIGLKMPLSALSKEPNKSYKTSN